MTFADLQALLPLLIVTATAVLVMLVAAFLRNHRLVAGFSFLGLIAAFITVFITIPLAPHQVTPLFLIDWYALWYISLMLAIGIVVVMLSYSYWQMQLVIREEYYILLLLAVLGCMVLVASTHFASFFLGLEILSVALYGLVAYRRDNQLGIEAGLKYLILAGTSAAFILFGMALIYADLGTMQLAQMVAAIPGDHHSSILLFTGVGMILVGVGFKLAVFPFHLWTPDIYEGAPVPVTAFIATASKGAVFGLLLRYFTPLQINRVLPMVIVISVIAFASMFAGNLLALRQKNLKRILAYSSIANMGYLLVAFLASGSLGVITVTFYLTAYVITILTAFGVMTVLSCTEKDADILADYRGLAWQHPWLAGIMTASLLSLAGMPLTAGFVGKFLILTSGVSANLWLLVITLVVNSGLGLYYYLRIVREIYHLPAERSNASIGIPFPQTVPLLASLALAVLVLLLVWLGVYPAPVIRLLQAVQTSISP